MPKARGQIRKSLVVALVLIIGCLGGIVPVFAEDLGVLKEEKVRAYFVGYDGNDLVFQILNDAAFDIKIRGLSFHGQILYRPLEKSVVIHPVSQMNPAKEVKFRSPNDFVWSQNHMKKFRLAYVRLDSNERLFADIYPKEEPAVK
ncbi:MAG TPA: hypothetical protein VI749_00115 [Candidatus Omnitrophota bacterium]|nr:hypothetical protein [Candidatus Omnitrophota bacterium]